MAVKEVIAIAEATGKTGSAIAHKLAGSKYRLILTSGDEDKLLRLVSDIKKASPTVELEATDSIKDACWEADIIIIPVRTALLKELAETIKEVATQKIVVQAIDARELFPPNTDDQIQELLPYSKI